jgi:UDP-N-acetylglucosamine 1-carboxyvinyltransferase
MDKIVIKGGTSLHGSIEVSGAKNAALPILMSSILSDGVHKFENVPCLADISSTLSLLGRIGCPSLVTGEQDSHVQKVEINSKEIAFCEAPYDLVRKMRASVLVLGPLLARKGYAKVSLPGGCAIGNRPIDQHLKGLEALGCTFEIKSGYIEGKVEHLKGSEIHLDFPTVGGTENILMAATLADGITTIHNAAREPEIVDLVRFLRSMGARIKGEGSSCLEIDGVPALRASRTPYSIMGDRIEAGTFLLLPLMTGGEVTLVNAPIAELSFLCNIIEEAGANITTVGEQITVQHSGSVKPVSVVTSPHPGFPTDMQAQWMTAMTQADGFSTITEKIFENRFMHVPELKRLGAEIHTEGRVAQVQGRTQLQGANVMATDLRASASLIMAGLAAKGQTEVLRVYHLDRGYAKLVSKLQGVGANLGRFPDYQQVEL